MKTEEAKAALETELFRIFDIQKCIRWIFENHIVEPLECNDLESRLQKGENALVSAALNDMQLYAETVRNLMDSLQEEIGALQIE